MKQVQEKKTDFNSFCSRYFQYHRKTIFIFLLFCAIFACAFALYHLPLGAIGYPALVCGLFGMILFFLDIRRAWKKHQLLMEMYTLPADMMEAMPEVSDWEDEDYQKVLLKLWEEQKFLADGMSLKVTEMVDYYTLWAHQIKTPIASMRLNLQKEDSRLSRALLEDLLRIEQYVEMVLAYLRLDADSTDYVIQEYDLDDMIRQAVKKFAGWFINKRLTMEYEPTHLKVVTDEKWMVFCIEQVLSNALKYTETGKIMIYLEKPATLCIRDTGIGIAKQDLPRIFEKGYTGYNGRSDKRASGIGLYLCKRICRNLGHSIFAESMLGEGTTIRIDLNQTKVEVE